MLRSPGTASPFAPPVEDLIDLRGVRAFARRERLGQIEERVPRQIPFPRRPFGESLACGLLQGEPFGFRGPQDERIDHGIHLRLDDLLPTHRKGKWTWTIYMFSLHVSTRWDPPASDRRRGLHGARIPTPAGGPGVVDRGGPRPGRPEAVDVPRLGDGRGILVRDAERRPPHPRREPGTDRCRGGRSRLYRPPRPPIGRGRGPCDPRLPRPGVLEKLARSLFRMSADLYGEVLRRLGDRA